MHDVSLAIVWHQHQPYYPDDVGDENPMPWVRLHATRDYWGMAMLLREIPEFHCTINLVPSLLAQLQAYLEEGHEDRHLQVSRRPADGLAEADMHYLLDNFFMVHPDHMIRPYPRYYELYRKRGMGMDGAARAAKRFTRQDVIDLQIWSNLTWIHPLAFERDKTLAEFRERGRQWSEDDKVWLLEQQRRLMAEVVPLHRELQQRGQLEISTTPFYHPILPLLWDKRLARRAMPDVHLPRYLDGYAEDGLKQIEMAVAYHEKLFGRKPRGMWPSEGSVCEPMIGAVAASGIQWIATDEEILSCSTEGWVARDGQGYLRHPHMLYRPWRLEQGGQELQIVFRDHAMSDQIGFHYQRFHAEHAVDDFLGKLDAIGRATHENAGERPSLVSIILDGENCWEYYPNSGVDFLRGLYRRVVAHPKIKPVRVCDYLEKYPAKDKIGHLFPGSWIQHNFGIWIGHPECNRAWDLLFETRAFLQRAEAEGQKTPEQIKVAWREMFIAEGSDWFWWFGDSHTSAQDAVFDRLFRKHLQNVFLVLEEPCPGELLRPISQAHEQARLHTEPTSLLKVKIDGQQTYFEWLNAGHHRATGSRGTMSMQYEGRITDLYFGFDDGRLLIRCDVRGGMAREQLADISALRIAFEQPEGFELLVSHPDWQEPILQLYHNDVPVAESGVLAASDRIVELAVPLRTLGATTDDAIQFHVELLQGDDSVERAPVDGAVETRVPSPEFEMMMWQA